MSEENVELVRSAIDALNRGDWDAALEYAGLHFEFDASRAAAAPRGVHRGGGSVWIGFLQGSRSARLEPQDFIEVGEHVVVPWAFHAVGHDGVELDARGTWTWTIRDGAIERICMHQEREEALEAVRLRE